MSSSSLSIRLAGRFVIALVLLCGVRIGSAQTATDTADVAVNGPEGALLLVDGKQIGTLPLADILILPAGRHRFALQRGNKQAETDALTLPAHRLTELHLSLNGQRLLAVLHTTPVLLLSIDPPPPGQGPGQDDAGEAATDRIEQIVAAAARREHTQLLRRDRQIVILQHSTELGRCLKSGDCHEPLFHEGEVSYVLSLNLGDVIRAELLDVRTRDIGARAEERCAPCDLEQSAERIDKMVRRMLVETVGRRRGTLAVTSNPPGANVVIDGRWLGRTPYRSESFAGPHTLEVERDGFITDKSSIDVSPNRTATAQVTLQLRPGTASAERARPRWRLYTGGALVGSGLLLGGFGASALWVNGQCQDGAERLSGCTPFYNTLAVGSGLLAAGAALAITGTVLLAVPERKRRATTAQDPRAALAGAPRRSAWSDTAGGARRLALLDWTASP